MKNYDIDAEAVKRVPPVMPEAAKESGYCCMVFDITTKGQPTNVKARYCAKEYFQQPSVSSVSKWKYTPAKSKGKPVTRYGVSAKIVYTLNTRSGYPVPSHTGFLTRKNIKAQLPMIPSDQMEHRLWVKRYFSQRKPCGDLVS